MSKEIGKIYLWSGKVPYNSEKSKLEDMKICGNPKPVLQVVKMLLSIIGKRYRNSKKQVDTLTYVISIKKGIEKETYEDLPYIEAHVVKGSKKSVILVPGGAFTYKQSDIGDKEIQMEGYRMAELLRERGISAFVLWYRSNPYKFPVPSLDLQRAIRYVRFCSKEFGIEDNVGISGFSAGGYLVAYHINEFSSKNLFPQNYVPDAIDEVSDSVDFAAMMYPCLTFRYNVPMLFAAFDEKTVKDKASRERLLSEYDCIEKFSSAEVPQFLAYGTKDILVNKKQAEDYSLKLANNPRSKCLPVVGANHGFGAGLKDKKKFDYWLDEYLDWCEKV